jgi:hypothetical protein
MPRLALILLALPLLCAGCEAVTEAGMRAGPPTYNTGNGGA